MKEYYEIEIAGLKRQLPLCPLTDKLYIGAFVIFGDVELTERSAAALLEKAPADYDYMITAESKGIPLIHEMARQSGVNKYFLARKAPKLYMRNVLKCEVKSITTAKKQTLYLDGDDAELMRGKRILVIDDVISTGESLNALEALVNQAGGIIAGRMAILAEGDAWNRDDIVALQYLPLFDENGDPIPV
ncbi:MAG: adenine phosphoribosyltransferase [Clostridia bacterium]|nr:adenine phosphoribosyltransferase [Clostridia bacterium]